MGERTDPRVESFQLVFKSQIITNHKGRDVRETVCAVMAQDVEVPVAFGIVRCHKSDHDCRFTAQRAALKKTLSNFVPGKEHRETRRELWHQFLMRSKKGRALIGAVDEIKVQNQN